MMTKKFKFRISRVNLSLTPEGQFYGKKKKGAVETYTISITNIWADSTVP